MKLSVDTSSGVPPFEQVREGIRTQVASGTLAPGLRLPPVRSLAADLDLAANTVARAYKELEAQGLVVSRSRAGTVVAPRAQSVEIALRHLADSLVQRAVEAGVDDAAVLSIVRAALGDVRR